MKFMIKVSDKAIKDSGCTNKAQITKLIRSELQGCGGAFEPGEWQQSVLSKATVKEVKE